jgi:hypothetical protein
MCHGEGNAIRNVGFHFPTVGNAIERIGLHTTEAEEIGRKFAINGPGCPERGGSAEGRNIDALVT